MTIAASSKGRTADSCSADGGSTPPAATFTPLEELEFLEGVLAWRKQNAPEIDCDKLRATIRRLRDCEVH